MHANNCSFSSRALTGQKRTERKGRITHSSKYRLFMGKPIVAVTPAPPPHEPCGSLTVRLILQQNPRASGTVPYAIAEYKRRALQCIKDSPSLWETISG